MLIHHNSPLILDGGMSRELIRLKAPFAQPEWSALSLIQAPHHVKQVHTDFLSAGTDIITTNSYAVVPFHIGDERFWCQGPDLIALSGRLAREAADEAMARSPGRKVLVAGCLPPVFGSYEPDKFVAGEVQRYLDVLVASLDRYVDFWLAETLSLVAEAEAALLATSKTGKGVWVSFCPDDREKGSAREPKLRSGESIEDVARWAVHKGREGKVQSLLFNCCRPQFIDGALDAAISVFKTERGGGDETERLPRLGVYANAFVPRSNESAANEDISATDTELTPDAYAAMAVGWQENGAYIIGGCCGIGHDHISAAAKALKSDA